MQAISNALPQLLYTIELYYEDDEGCHGAGTNGMTYFSFALAEKLVDTKYQTFGIVVGVNDYTQRFLAAEFGQFGPTLPYEDTDLPY